jgi:hypothetical protein
VTSRKAFLQVRIRHPEGENLDPGDVTVRFKADCVFSDGAFREADFMLPQVQIADDGLAIQGTQALTRGRYLAQIRSPRRVSWRITISEVDQVVGGGGDDDSGDADGGDDEGDGDPGDGDPGDGDPGDGDPGDGDPGDPGDGGSPGDPVGGDVDLGDSTGGDASDSVVCYWLPLDAPPDVIVDDADLPEGTWQVYVCDGPRPPGDDTPDYRWVPGDPDENPVPPEPPVGDPADGPPDESGLGVVEQPLPAGRIT